MSPSREMSRSSTLVRNVRGARRHLAQDRPGAVEVAEQQIGLGRQDAADVGGEPAAGLQRGLHEHAERHRGRTVLLEVPRVGGHVVLGVAALPGSQAGPAAPSIATIRVMKWYGRPGQAREAARAVEARVAGPEGLGGPSPRAGEQRGVVLPHPVDSTGRPSRPRHRLGLAGILRGVLRCSRPTRPPSTGRGTSSPAAAPWAARAGASASSGQSGTSRTAARRAWNALTPSTVPSTSAYSVGRDPPRARDTKTSYTISRLAGLTWPRQRSRYGSPGHGLEAPAVPVEREAERGQVERHGLQAALEHQRARHAGVVLEVPVEEPVVRRSRRPRRAGSRGPSGPPAGSNVGDLVSNISIRPAPMRGVRTCALAAAQPGPKQSAGRPSAKARTSAAIEAAARAPGRPARRAARRPPPCCVASQSTPSVLASSSSVKKPACPLRTVSRSRRRRSSRSGRRRAGRRRARRGRRCGSRSGASRPASAGLPW